MRKIIPRLYVVFGDIEDRASAITRAKDMVAEHFETAGIDAAVPEPSTLTFVPADKVTVPRSAYGTYPNRWVIGF